MISGQALGGGCLAPTLSKRAPVPRAARASISHSRSDLRNQRDEEQSGLSRRPDLSLFFPPVFSFPRMYFRPSLLSLHFSFYTQPISITWPKCASNCSLRKADLLERAQEWSLFRFSLIKLAILDLVTKMEAIFRVQVA